MTENPIPWRVIRAAPDLLEALEALYQNYSEAHDGISTRLWDQARTAIAKAKGELQPEERKENAAN
jgi:hypothetical protein